MTISETTRREMHTRLVEILGTEVADTLMEHLPPVGWADVATKRDVALVETNVRLEMAAGLSKVEATVSDKINQQTRTMMFGLLSTMFATIGAVGAISALAH